MKIDYKAGEVIHTAETAEDGYNLAEIVHRAKADGYPLSVVGVKGTLTLCIPLRVRAPAEKREKKQPASETVPEVQTQPETQTTPE